MPQNGLARVSKLGLMHENLSFPIQNEILQLAIRIPYVLHQSHKIQSRSLPQNFLASVSSQAGAIVHKSFIEKEMIINPLNLGLLV